MSYKKKKSTRFFYLYADFSGMVENDQHCEQEGSDTKKRWISRVLCGFRET
jgi:hypothetical protein